MKTYIGPHSYHNSLVILHSLHGLHLIQGLLASRCAQGKGTFAIFWMPGAIRQARSSAIQAPLKRDKVGFVQQSHSLPVFHHATILNIHIYGLIIWTLVIWLGLY